MWLKGANASPSLPLSPLSPSSNEILPNKDAIARRESRSVYKDAPFSEGTYMYMYVENIGFSLVWAPHRCVLIREVSSFGRPSLWKVSQYICSSILPLLSLVFPSHLRAGRCVCVTLVGFSLPWQTGLHLERGVCGGLVI